MSIAIRATYEDGVLKPNEPINLTEHQEVRLVIVDEVRGEAEPARVEAMLKQIETWLAVQPSAAAREPKLFSAAERKRLNDDFDGLLAELRQRSALFTAEEIGDDVDEAVAAARLSHE